MESSFSYIFTDDMIDMIVLRTNQEADREIAHRELGEELAERWFPLSKEEARAFFTSVILARSLKTHELTLSGTMT